MSGLDVHQRVIACTGHRRSRKHVVEIAGRDHQVGARAPFDLVITGRTQQRVIAVGTGQRGVSGIEPGGIDRVVTGAAGQYGQLDSGQQIVAAAGEGRGSEHLVGVGVLLDLVVAGAAIQGVIGCGSQQRVVASGSQQRGGTPGESRCVEPVGRWSPDQFEVLDACQHIGSVPGQLRVGGDLVVVDGLADPVGTTAPGQRVTGRRTDQGVIATTTVERDGAVGEGFGSEQVCRAAAAEPAALDRGQRVDTTAGQLGVGQHLVAVGQLLDLVGSVAADKRVVALATDQRVVAVVTVERDNADGVGPGVEQIVADAASQLDAFERAVGVVAVAGQRGVGQDLVGVGGLGEHVQAVTAIEGVVGGRTRDGVVPEQAGHVHRPGRECRGIDLVVLAVSGQRSLFDLRENIQSQSGQRGVCQNLVGPGDLDHHVGAITAV